MRFPPVRPLPTLDAWSAPQKLDAQPEQRRMAVAIASGAAAQARSATATREAHRYAQINGSVIFQITTTPQLVLPAPQNFRNLLMMRNTGANVLYIEFGRDASNLSTIQLQPNQIILFDTVVPQDDVSAVTGAGTAQLSLSFSNVNFIEPEV